MTIITLEVITKLISRNSIPLKSTQPKLCIPIINRIYKKMLLGIKFDSIKVCENLVCDGHHRYIASLLTGYSLDTTEYIITSATKTFEWNSVLFDNEDWDTAAKIKFLNEQDAIFNNMPLQKLMEILDEK